MGTPQSEEKNELNTEAEQITVTTNSTPPATPQADTQATAPDKPAEVHSAVANGQAVQTGPYKSPGLFKGTWLPIAGALLVAFLVVGTVWLLTEPAKNKTAPAPATNTPAAIAPAQVSITKDGFVPSTISVKVGQAVVWTNSDTNPHLVASDPYPTNNRLPDLNSRQNITDGSSYSYVFTSSGTYTYHDNLNPSMTGTVIVK